MRNWLVAGAEQVLTYPHPAVKLLNGTTPAVATYLHRDGLTSVRALTNPAGVKIEAALYKPFGEQTEWLLPGNPAPETKGWIGERYDADAGLQYLNARYYDPELSLFLQPDWFEVTKAGVGTNRFSYSFNDPVNGLDPNGNSCYQNGGSGHCERSKEYGELADDEELTKRTSFMHAAESVTWALADIDRSQTAQWWTGGSSIVASEPERKFFEDVGQRLFKENMKVVETIREGEGVFGLPSNASPEEVDRAWVRFEQKIVQQELDLLLEQNPSLYAKVVDLANSSMRELRSGTLARVTNPNQAAALDMLDEARRGTGWYQTWDFSRIEDRIAMGDAATSLMRRKLGLDNGN